MKKQARKLELSRETLRMLAKTELSGVFGGENCGGVTREISMCTSTLHVAAVEDTLKG